ncbi:hypothetical protein PoB_003716000 [Plakobranchus ocellatus]|uniref:Uncharacterized protein n=1 Tax=Plakobranchus ocellatus TaxID=259542 RepID=A0AAV4ATL5_9GAST|nr:hypothetical protein PoB_003716000 [Plakobranchus ocellatus]
MLQRSQDLGIKGFEQLAAAESRFSVTVLLAGLTPRRINAIRHMANPETWTCVHNHESGKKVRVDTGSLRSPPAGLGTDGGIESLSAFSNTLKPPPRNPP